MSDDLPVKAGNAFTKKIGPLPAYAYVVIVVGVAYAVYYAKGKQVSTKFVPLDNADGAAGQDSSAGESSPMPPQGGYGGTVTTGNGSPASTTNAIWARNVSNALIAQGDDPGAVSNAISNYLTGKELNAQQQAIVNLAIQQFGVPPQGVIPYVKPPTVTKPPVVTPPPVVKPPVVKPPPPKPAPPKPAPPKPAPPKPAPPKPAPVVYYTVRSGDNLSTIAQRYYGVQDWQKIYNANRAKIGSNPNLIQPGWVLVIPK